MALTVLVSAIFLLLEPEELAEPADRISYSVFTKLFSELGEEKEVEAGEDIGVVLLNQESLASLGESWPPDYSVHASVLETLLPYRPRGIFLDFLLVDERSDATIQELTAILEVYRALDIPVYVSAGNSHDHFGREVRPELQGLVIPVAGWTNTTDRRGLTYDLLPMLPQGQEQEQDRMPSAALQMYRDVCGNTHSAPQNCFELTDQIVDQRDMWLVWPRRLPDYQEYQRINDSVQRPLFQCEMRADDLSLLMRLVAYPLSLFDPTAGKVSTCGPQLAISAHDVIYRSPEEGAPYVSAFEGRYIFYGFDLQGFQDFVNPPVTSHAIPGVFIHATAFENLLALGEKYLSLRPESETWRWLNADVIEVVTLFIVLLIHNLLVIFLYGRIYKEDESIYKKEYNSSENIEINKYIKSLFYLIKERKGILLISCAIIEFIFMVSLLFFVSYYLEYVLLDIAPINWIAILGIFSFNLLLSARLLTRIVIERASN